MMWTFKTAQVLPAEGRLPGFSASLSPSVRKAESLLTGLRLNVFGEIGGIFLWGQSYSVLVYDGRGGLGWRKRQTKDAGRKGKLSGF